MWDRNNDPSPYLTSREAADYLRFRNASGIRTVVMRGELVPDGSGPRGTHLFLRGTLDRFILARSASKMRRLVRLGKEA